jgi:hypothetical protein
MPISTPMSITEFDDLFQMMEWMDEVHPQGFPCTRDGIRLGIAAIQDETSEVWKEWEANKRAFGKWLPNSDSLEPMRQELLQVAAITMRIVRSIDVSRET